MNSRSSLLTLVGALALMGAIDPVVAAPVAPPNIVLILADDLGYGDLGCYGHAKFKTPHLDRLATEGARLTQFNTPAPFCAPTRASLLTGRYPFRHGLTGNPAPDGRPPEDVLHLPESEITLAQLFTRAGYASGMIGKWHLGHAQPEWLPTRRGFGEYFGILYSNDMRPVKLIEGDQPVEYPVVQATLTQRYTARAVDFIARHRARPFFLYLAHAMPHKPLAASAAFYRKSGAGLYGDVIAELDASVGEVLAQLDRLGLTENTLVIFTSDNGASYGGSTGGLRGAKGSSYEGGYRVPCLARWPGKIPRGHVSHAPAVTMDLFATVLKVAGVPAPSDRVIDGRDLMSLFTSAAPSPHDVILGHLGAQVATVRDARWKLHVQPGRDARAKPREAREPYVDPRGPDGTTLLAPTEQYTPADHPGLVTGAAPAPLQLFDLQADPGEQRDVAAQHPDVVTRLHNQFNRLLAGAPAPTRPPQ